jgi:hypothetical protein
LGIGEGGMALIAATGTSNLVGIEKLNLDNSFYSGALNGSLSSLAVLLSPTVALSKSGYRVFSAVASLLSEFAYDTVSFGLDWLSNQNFSYSDSFHIVVR